LLLRDRAYIGVMWGQQRMPVSPITAFSRSVDLTAQTFGYIAQYPVQLYQTVSGLFNHSPRNPSGAVSIVGVGQAAGSIASNASDSPTDRFFMLLYLVGALNIALFAFNMIPLPPLDGGHIAGAIYEYLKRGWFRLRGIKGEVTVDTALMAPFATFMFLVLFGTGILLMLVDFINPVQL
jgi:membrane-associated protease RseP (regulator of RpoE activity)